jgi:tetratricopeptide (TPR) repeat protein
VDEGPAIVFTRLDLIEELEGRWKKSQDVDSTIQLCDALSAVRTTLVQQVADFAQVKFASNVPVLVAVSRMYMRANKLAEAQSVLVAAGKIAPRDGLVYRVLGEVLLRRGDADRAEKVFERAMQFGQNDDQTKTWLERSRVFKAMQAKAGSRAVASEIARTAPLDPPPPKKSSRPPPLPPLGGDFDEAETEIRMQAAPSSPNAPPALVPKERKYPMNAPTIEPFSPRSDPAPMPVPVFMPPRQAEARSAPVAPARDVKIAKTNDVANNPFRAPSGPAGVPDARDVLDSLQLAGVYEASGAAPLKWDRATRTRRRGTFPLVAITLLFVGGGIGGFRYVRQQREKAHVQAEGMLNQIEADMRKSQGALLAPMEQQFSQVFDLDSRNERVALDWLRERALSGLLRSGADVAFEDGLTRARELKIPEEKLVFAQVASFLFQGDTVGAAALLAKSDAKCKDDAWYQLMAGATLERAGSNGAKDRYDAATKLDPELIIAQVGLVRSTAIDADPVKAMELAKTFRAKWSDRPEGPALIALAWARDPARGENAPPEVAETLAKGGELPIGLRFVPNTVAALQAIDKHDPATARTEVQKGLTVVEGPGPASWFGIIALDTGDEALAQKAALAAVAFSAVYPPARVLAARVALLGNRLDEALKATEDLDATSPDVAVVRAATAYERVDATNLSGALDAIPAETRGFPFLEALNIAPQVLVGRAQMTPDKLIDMSDDEAPWADLVAMDMALEGGDVSTAAKIADKWKGSESRPLRALRLSRLARYQGKLDDADQHSQTALVGTVTTRSLMERVLVLVAREKAPGASQLLARYPLVLGSLAGWLGAYASASAGKLEDARGKTASLEPPPQAAPLVAREIAALAMGAMKDRRRGPDYLKELFASGAVNPDTAAAAAGVGIKAPDKPPVRRER